MEKRTAHEKEKYQPSYDTTILTEVKWYVAFAFAREAEVCILALPLRWISQLGGWEDWVVDWC
jgi:hypothetical protein